MARKKQKTPENPQATALAVASRLTGEQAVALRCIVEGRSMVEAAAAAGVDRTTLYRWRTEDEKFLVALEAWRREQVNNAYDRLSGMTVVATNVVGDAISGGDARLAFRVLEKIGVAAPRPTPEPEAKALATQATQYKRFTFRVDNPGNNHAAVQQFVSTLIDGDLRIAGNITYRQHFHPYAADRRVIDSILQELAELGASASLQAVTIVKVDDGIPDGHKPGPEYVRPSIMSGPAWAVTLSTTETGGVSNRYPNHEEVVAHNAARHARIAELERMDAADDEAKAAVDVDVTSSAAD